MKNVFYLLALSLVSCATMTPQQQDEIAKTNFIGQTACMKKSSAKRVQSIKNAFGNEVTRSYLFTCGQEKYACVMNYDINTYRWYYKCNPKISYTSR